MRNSSQQQGKGLIVFLAGSAVALIAIVILLFVLNKNNNQVFKEPKLVAQPQQTEILTPKDSDTKAHYSVDEVAVSHEVTSNVQPIVVENLPQESIQQELIDVKPTAQQILDSGNLEKAKKLAKAEAVIKQLEQQKEVEHQKTVASRQQQATVEDVNQSVVEKKNDTKSVTQNVHVQVGAFSDRHAAENQKAQLALMGVQTQIVSIQTDDKIIYRVQTDKLSADKAQQVKKMLQTHGIKVYVRQ